MNLLGLLSFSEREMLNGPPSVILTPSLVQEEFVGGPPLVSPIRLKVGGSVRNEEEERDTWFVEIPPSKNKHG